MITSPATLVFGVLACGAQEFDQQSDEPWFDVSWQRRLLYIRRKHQQLNRR
jgi:hypothetical protein